MQQPPPTSSKLLTTDKSKQEYIGNIGKDILIKNVIIMDWDDTIFPTTAFTMFENESKQIDLFTFIDESYDKYPALSTLVAVIDKCITDSYNFMINHIVKNDAIVLIVSNASYYWLNQCLYGSKRISNLESVQKLKQALFDAKIPIKLISAKSEFIARSNEKVSGAVYKETTFINELKLIKMDYLGHIFCVYCVGDSLSEFVASINAMKNVFNRNEYFILIRHKLNIKYTNPNTVIQSMLLNLSSFYCWNKYCIIEMLLKTRHIHIGYDIYSLAK